MARRLLFAGSVVAVLLLGLVGDVGTVAAVTGSPPAGLSGARLEWVSIDPADPQDLRTGNGFDLAWSSTDGGASWQPASRYLQRATYDPSTPGLVYFSRWDGTIWRSTDGGATTRMVFDAQDVPYGSNWTGAVRAMAVAASGRLYVGTGLGGVFESDDHGQTWQADNDGLPSGLTWNGLQLLTFAVSAQGHHAYVSYSDGTAFRQTDSSAWLPITKPSVYAVDRFIPDPVDGATVYMADGNRLDRSDDAGQSWTRLGGLPDDSTVAPQTFAIAPSAPQTMYVEMGIGIARSTDGGQSWSSPSDVFQGEWSRQIAVSPSDPSTAYTVLPAGVFASTDGGQTWEPRNTGVLSANFVLALATQPGDPNVVFAGTEGGLWRSLDGGATWATSMVGLLPNSSHVDSITFDPRDPSTVYIDTMMGFYLSHDAGESWQLMTPGWTLGGPSVAIDPSDSTHLVWPMDYGVFVSHDGGETHQTQRIVSGNGTSTNEDLSRATFDAFQPNVIYAAGKAGVWRSSDDGDTWTQVLNLGVPTNAWPFASILAVDPTTPGLVYYGVANEQLYVSHDGGETWAKSLTDDAMTLTLDTTTTPATAYVERAWNLPAVRSTDGGVSWVPEDDAPTTSPSAASLAGTTTIQGLFRPARKLYLGNRTVRQHTFIAATPSARLTLPITRGPNDIRLNTRWITLRVRCYDSWHEPCRGRVTLTSQAAAFATARYHTPAGRRTIVQLRLPRPLWGQLGRGRVVRLRAVVDSIGQDRRLTTDRRSLYVSLAP